MVLRLRANMRRDLLVLVAPKVFPPFDSAFSSIGFNLFRSLVQSKKQLASQVTLLSSYNLLDYVKFYNLLPTELLIQIQKFYSTIRKQGEAQISLINHTWSPKDNISLIYLLLKYLQESQRGNDDIVVISLFPLKMVFLHLLHKKLWRNTKFLRYLFYIPSWKEFFSDILAYDLVLVSSKTLTNYIRHALTMFIPPPIDSHFFKPLTLHNLAAIIDERFKWHHKLLEAKRSGKTILLYMGPLHPDRFPVNGVIRLLRLLIRKGLNPLLVIATTIRQIGVDDKYVALWRSISDRLKGLIRLYVKALGEEEKLILYNLADVVLYPTIKHLQLAIPPLTILEAHSCAKPVVHTTRIPAYWEVTPEEFSWLAAVRPIAEELFKTIKSALDMSSQDKNALRAFVTKNYSIDVVSKRLQYVLTRTLVHK